MYLDFNQSSQTTEVAHEGDDYREQLPAIGETLSRTVRQACSRKVLKRRVPISIWASKYQKNFFFQDMVAGITVGLTAIPQSIAYAIVADLPPQYGLYSAFVGCFMYIFLGSCKASTIGPTAIMAIMTQPFVGGKNPDFAVLLTFLKGCIVFLFGFLNLGFLVQFISSSVISGFTTAAACTIASTQLKNLFGLPGSGSDFTDAWIDFFQNIQHIRIGDTILGLSSIVILYLLKKLGQQKGKFEGLKKYIALGRNALVDIGGGVIAYILFINGYTPFKLTGDIANGFPSFGLPPFSTQVGNETIGFVEMVGELGTAPITLAFVSILEGITVATIFCENSKTVDATQEMIAIGASNILGSFFSSMPTTSSFTRSAINNASGVRSPLGGIFTGSMVLLALGFLTSFFYYLPKATLAAVIISAMIQTMEFEEFLHTWKTKRIDIIPLTITLLSCLFIGLEIGIVIGICVNIFIILYTNSRPTVDSSTFKIADNEILVIVPNGDIIFSSADYFRFQVTKSILKHPDIRHIVLDGKYIQSLDVSAAKKITNLVGSIKSQDKQVVLWNWKQSVCSVLVRHKVELKELLVSTPSFDDLALQLKSSQSVQTITIPES